MGADEEMAWCRAASLGGGRMRKCARPPTRGKRHGTTRSVRWLDAGGRVDPTTSPRRGNNVRPKLFLCERERLLAKPLGPERRVPELQLAIVAVRGGKRAELGELALGRGPRLDGEHLRELVDRVDAVLVAACNVKGHCNGERPLSIGARPCCDVPAAASEAQPAFAWSARERATALAAYQEEAQHACARRARAVPHWL